MYPWILRATISALLPRSFTAIDGIPNSEKQRAKMQSDALENNFSEEELASIYSGIVPIYFTISIIVCLSNSLI